MIFFEELNEYFEIIIFNIHEENKYIWHIDRSEWRLQMGACLAFQIKIQAVVFCWAGWKYLKIILVKGIYNSILLAISPIFLSMIFFNH